MSLLKELPASFTLEDKYFEKRISLSTTQIDRIQERLIRQAYLTAWDRITFYRETYRRHGLKKDSLKSVADLKKLPFTCIDDIRATPSIKHNALIHLAVPREKLCLIHTSSGTTGRSKVFGYTGRDIISWASNVATCFWLMGFRKNDVFVSFDPFGEYTGGGGLYLGLTMMGLTYIPLSVGPGITEKIIAHITGKLKLGEKEIELDPLQVANSLGGIPSFMTRLEEELDQRGIDPSKYNLKKGAFGAEAWSESMRKRIEAKFAIDARDMYGLGEFLGPGVASECAVKDGLHLLSDSFIAEVIDPETTEPVAEGQEGELVLTSLKKEAMPFLRYRTGDKTVYMGERCRCGINHSKIGRIKGRVNKDEIILPGGINVNRVFLEEIILSEKEVSGQYALSMEYIPEKAIKKLHIAVEADMDKAKKIEESLTRKIQIEYNHSPVVKVFPKNSLPRNPGKAKRIFSESEYKQLIGSIRI